MLGYQSRFVPCLVVGRIMHLIVWLDVGDNDCQGYSSPRKFQSQFDVAGWLLHPALSGYADRVVYAIQ